MSHAVSHRMVYAESPEHAVALAQAGFGVPVEFGVPARRSLLGFRTPVISGQSRGARAAATELAAGQHQAGAMCPSGCWDGWWAIGLGALGFAAGGLLGWQVATSMQLGTAFGKALPALLPAL